MKGLSTFLVGLTAGGAFATLAMAQDYNPNNAPAFTNSYTERNLDAQKAAQAMLATRIGEPVTVYTLLASPYPKANQYCGLAVTKAGGLYTFNGAGAGELSRISEVAPVTNTLNGVAMARSKLFADCGGVALAHTIVEYGYPGPAANLSPYLR